MARGIPISPGQLPKTTTSLGGFQPARGLEGMRGDTSALTRSAGNAPLINARGFIVSAASVGDIGRAVEQQGSATLDLINKQNEAIGIRKEQEAIASMDAEEMAISTDISNEPDETKWADIAAKRGKALSERVLTPDLSPAARDAIGLRLDGWQKRIAGITLKNSARKSFDKARDAVGAGIIRAVDRGDYMGAQALGRKAVDAGYMSEEDFARTEVDMQRRAEKNKADAAYGFAVSNPDVFLADPEKYTEGLDAQQKDSITTQARQAKRQNLADTANAFTDRLYGGEFQTLADMQAAFPEELGAKAKAEAEHDFVELRKPGVLAKMEEDAPANFARLTDEIEAYDPKKDEKGEKFVRLNQDIKRSLSASDPREQLLNSLQKKYSGSGGIDPSEPLKQTVSGILTTMFEAGAFGNFKKLVPQKDASGKERPELLPREVEDPKAKLEAQGKRGQAMLYMHKWMEANPTADPGKATDVIRQFLAGNAPLIRASAVRQAPPDLAPATPNAPWQAPELPEAGGGEPDNSLIPFNLPPSQQSR